MRQRSFLVRFLVRWLVCSLGLWIAAALFSSSLTYGGRAGVLIIAGLILAIANSVIKPVLVLLSLPAILLTLGLFMIVINGLLVLFVAWVYDSLEVANFGTAMLAGIVIGLVNYLVSAILETQGGQKSEHL